MPKARKNEVIARSYPIDGSTYPAIITRKKIRRFILRYRHETKTLYVSAPFYSTLEAIDGFVLWHASPLIKKVENRHRDVYDGNFLYVFGEKKEVGELEEGEVDAYYKKIGLPYLKQRVAYYCQLMGVNATYKVRMRKMRRTHGSNSRRTMALTFQTRLIAFDPSIIDSVVVHELAHHFEFNHSEKFYAVVYRYCPNYDTLRRKLNHDQFAG